MLGRRIATLTSGLLATMLIAPLVMALIPECAAEEIEHDSIYILGNDDFTAENGVTAGTGTQSDPYIIEGWSIVNFGIDVRDTDAFLTIKSNSIYTSYSGCAISLSNVSHVLVSDCNLDGGGNGLIIHYSQDVRIVGNTIHCGEAGYYGSNTMLWANDCHDLEIRENTLSNRGMFGARECADAEFLDNEASASHLTLSYCTGAVVTGNSLANGIQLTGDDPEHYDSHEIVGNTAGGYSIIYIVDEDSGTLSNANLGQVIAVNCDTVQISAIDLKSAAGVCVYFSESVTVTDCRIINSEPVSYLAAGVYAHECSEVTVKRCYISGEVYGIRTHSVGSLNVDMNFFDECSTCIRLFADVVNVNTNMMLDSNTAIEVEAVDAAEIYGNNLVNITQPLKQTYGSSFDEFEDIVWYSEYPFGGNYWDDYEGTDEFCGPDQDESGADGIGDTAYVDEDELVVDLYPLMAPVDVEFGPKIVTDDEDGTTSGIGTLALALAAAVATICVLGYAIYAINKGRRVRQRPPEL